jgi:hypothetical protein
MSDAHKVKSLGCDDFSFEGSLHEYQKNNVQMTFDQEMKV